VPIKQVSRFTDTPHLPEDSIHERIASWVQETHTATTMVSIPNDMHSDESSMGDYELVDTDGESRDDNATESVASTDFPRADDVASLADTEQSEDYSDDDGENGNPGNQVLHSFDGFANTPTIGHSIANMERTLSPPIEFEEPLSLGAENISVKHAIADFSEERTAEIVESMGMQNAPRRLVATIHQTMTKQGLSMESPLRILYVGSHAAKQDIIHKIASSVTASADNKFRLQSARHASQLYNVVPISDFGSERTPEIELMQSSGYQINVEDCTSAINMKFEDQPGKPDVIKLTLEGGFSYHSVPEGSEFTVEPAWDLPNVAVIYCSATDDLDARRTRTLAKTFMSRHGIPSIVISHKQIFDKSLGCMLLDQHALHMCLESRDPNGARNIIHQRLPIDLASFLNIDARQMNRNLAYLTGRHEIDEYESLQREKVNPTPTKSTSAYLRGILPNVVVDALDLEQIYADMVQSRSLMVPRVKPLLLAILALFMFPLAQHILSRLNPVTPSMSINNSLGTSSAIPMSLTSGTGTVAILAATSATKVPTLTKTSTTTVTVDESKSSIPNSLMSHIDLSMLSETLQNLASTPSTNKEQSCTAEVFDGHKILMRIPSGIKMSWLAKGDMSVDISRGGKAIATEKAYCSPDGIVLEIAKNEAFGLFNVSVVTTKKPKINEVFSIDFGCRSIPQDILSRLTSLMPIPIISKDLQAIRWNHSTAISRIFLGKTLNETRKLATLTRAGAEVVTKETLKTAHSASMELVKGSAVISKELGLRLADVNKRVSATLQDVESKLDGAVFKAQVRSKLYWLKLQGKHAEYERYKKRATEAMTAQAKLAASQTKKSYWATRKAARKEERQQRKAARAAKRTAKKVAKKAGLRT